MNSFFLPSQFDLKRYSSKNTNNIRHPTVATGIVGNRLVNLAINSRRASNPIPGLGLGLFTIGSGTTVSTSSSSKMSSNRSVSGGGSFSSINTALTRPSSALSKVLGKFNTVAGNFNIPYNVQSATKPSDRTKSNNIKASNITSYTIQQKIQKLLKLEEKVKMAKLSLTDDLDTWSSSIPNIEIEAMMLEFSALLKNQIEANKSNNENFDLVRLCLLDVFEREKKRKELFVVKDKLLHQLKELETKFGAGASSTALWREKLEENESNLFVVESQYLRYIEKNLKNTIIKYNYGLQDNFSLIIECSQNYFDFLLAVEQGLFSKGVHNVVNVDRISGEAIKTGRDCDENKISQLRNGSGNRVKDNTDKATGLSAFVTKYNSLSGGPSASANILQEYDQKQQGRHRKTPVLHDAEELQHQTQSMSQTAPEPISQSHEQNMQLKFKGNSNQSHHHANDSLRDIYNMTENWS